jgi:hypothetical protein
VIGIKRILSLIKVYSTMVFAQKFITIMAKESKSQIRKNPAVIVERKI